MGALLGVPTGGEVPFSVFISPVEINPSQKVKNFRFKWFCFTVQRL